MTTITIDEHLIRAYDKCEDREYPCTHDTARATDTHTLLSGDGPFAQGFVWKPESEAAIRAAGDWDQEIQDRIKAVTPQPIGLVFRGTQVNE